jgi:hypothetical protein
MTTVRSAPRRFGRLGALGTLAIALAVGSCDDDSTGLDVRSGRIALLPSFVSTNASIIPLQDARITLRRPTATEFELDTIIAISPTDTAVDLAVVVPVFSFEDEFELIISLIDLSGDTAFRGGPVIVKPTLGGGIPAPVPVEISYVGVGADAAGVRLLTDGLRLFVGDTAILVAEAFDSANAAIPGAPIGWTSLDSAVASFPVETVGRLVGRSRGITSAIAALPTDNPNADTIVVLVQPVPTEIAIVSGGAQSAEVEQALTDSVVVRVLAGDGLGVEGVAVRIATAEGVASPDSIVTDATGRAAFAWTLGPTAGTQTANLSIAEFPAVTGSVTATANPKPAVNLEIVSGDGQAGPVNTALGNPLVVLATDVDGTPVASTEITWTVLLNDGSTVPATSTTDAGGLASTTWTLGTLAGANEVEAALPVVAPAPESDNAAPATDASAELDVDDAMEATAETRKRARGIVEALPTDTTAVAQSSAFLPTVVFSATGVAGEPTLIEIVSGDAQSDSAGAVLPAPLVVKVTDLFGNPVQGVVVDFVASAGAVAPPSPSTDLAGLTQTSWTLGTTPAVDTVTASSGTLTPVQFTATVLAASGAAVVFQTEPGNAPAGGPIPDFAVAVIDQYGNLVDTSTAAVTVAIADNPSAGTLSGTTTVAAVAGVATFTGLSIDQFGNGYTLVATSGALVADTSVAFTIGSALGTAVWINASGGNWSDPTNWASGTVPSSTDSVFIDLDGTYTVTVDQDVTFEAMSVNPTAGTVTLAQAANTLTVTGTATLGPTAIYAITGGTLTGAGTVVVEGVLDWRGGAIMTGTGVTRLEAGGSGTIRNAVLDGRTFQNAGSIILTGGTGNALLGDNGAVFDNQAGATLDIETYPGMNVGAGAPPSFINGGRVEKSVGTGTTVINWPVTNTGVMATTNAGDIGFTGGGTLGGSLQTVTGGQLQLGDGRHG